MTDTFAWRFLDELGHERWVLTRGLSGRCKRRRGGTGWRLRWTRVPAPRRHNPPSGVAVWMGPPRPPRSSRLHAARSMCRISRMSASHKPTLLRLINVSALQSDIIVDARHTLRPIAWRAASSPPLLSQNRESIVSCSCTAQRSHRQSPPACSHEVEH